MTRRARQHRQAKQQEQIGTLAVVGALLIVAFLSNSQSGIFSSDVGFLALVVSVGIAAYGGLQYQKLQAKRRALRLLTLADVDTMTGTDFEQWVGEQLRLQGYRVVFTRTVGDYGVDIIASKGGSKTAVQVKRYKNVLGQAPVREAVAGMLYYRCSKAMVVTNSSFTSAAKTLAKANRCELVDREKLAGWLARHR